MQRVSVAHEFNFNSRIIKSVMEGNLVVSNREGHLFLTNQNLPDDSKCVIGFSVDTDKIKFTEGHVEAKFHIMVFHVEEISDDRWQMQMHCYHLYESRWKHSNNFN